VLLDVREANVSQLVEVKGGKVHGVGHRKFWWHYVYRMGKRSSLLTIGGLVDLCTRGSLHDQTPW